MKKIAFVLSTILLILISAFCIVGTVYSQERDKQKVDPAFYSQMEQDYKANLKEVLEEAYCNNSGITITHVTDEEGNRSYQVVIHHKLIDGMEESSRQNLLDKLSAVPFPDTTCTLEIGFLYYEEI